MCVKKILLFSPSVWLTDIIKLISIIEVVALPQPKYTGADDDDQIICWFFAFQSQQQSVVF